MASAMGFKLLSPSYFQVAFLSVLLLLTATPISAANSEFGYNPVKNFCSRWWSQSVVKDDVLYIDSGLQKWNGTDVSFGVWGTNKYLLTIPLKTTWDWKTNIVISSEPKNETNPATGTMPPSQIRGHMFHGPADSSQVYIYGGTTFMGNKSFPGYMVPTSSTYSMWTYNYSTNDYPWTQHDIGQPWMPNHGAGAEAIDQKLGFYLNGQIDFGTSSKTVDKMRNDTDYLPVDGMIVIDFNDHSSKNISTSSIRGNAPRVGGTMEYLAPVGGSGVLVALGGQINQQHDPWANALKGQLIDFSAVDVFDIDSYLNNPFSNGSWYQQNTTGSIPPPRINFCTVARSAPDNSSHHIYMYGGINPTKYNDTGFDDVYVLTIPSFTWTPVFTDGASPRWGHNCHLVGNRQLVTVGGNITNSRKCDWERKGLAFLDMTTITWGSVFLTNTTGFEVPQKLLGATGGTAQGVATIKEPGTGWTDYRLKKVFDTPRKWGPSQKKSINKGAIAGGGVAGILGLVLFISLLLWLKHRRNKARGPHELADDNIRLRSKELDDEEKKRYELQAVNENNPAELPGPDASELNAPRVLYEADGITATKAAELSGTNVVAGGRLGVPIVRTPGDDLPTPPLYTPGISLPPSDVNSPKPATVSSPTKDVETPPPVPAKDSPEISPPLSDIKTPPPGSPWEVDQGISPLESSGESYQDISPPETPQQEHSRDPLVDAAELLQELQESPKSRWDWRRKSF